MSLCVVRAPWHPSTPAAIGYGEGGGLGVGGLHRVRLSPPHTHDFIFDLARLRRFRWRFYIALMAASVHSCHYLIHILREDFVMLGGELQWYGGGRMVSASLFFGLLDDRVNPPPLRIALSLIF